MARKYDASRRAEQANQTREAILEAAFKLHGMGITDYESLAAEARVSLASVRKHFPNRESLYASCTSWAGTHVVAMPDFGLLSQTNDPEARLRFALHQMYAFYESMLGQLWQGHREADSSPVLQRQLREVTDLRQQLAGLALEPWLPGVLPDALKGLAEGFFSFLTYYALRTDGGLTSDEAAARIGDALLSLLGAPSLLRTKEAANR